MSPVHGLLVNSGIPVTVIEYDLKLLKHLIINHLLISCLPHRISSCKIDAQTSSSGGQEEDKNVLTSLKIRHHVSSLMYLAASVQPHVTVLSEQINN